MIQIIHQVYMIWIIMMISNLSCIPQVVPKIWNLDTREPPLKRHRTGYENVIKQELKKIVMIM